MIKGSIQEEDITIVNFYAPNIVSKFAQSCPTLCNPMDCSLPGSFVNGIYQARVLEWVSICSHNIGAPQYIKQILTDIKGEIDSNTIIVGDFITPLTPIDRSSKQKINKETQVLNDMLDEMDLIDIFRTFHPNAEEYTFFSSAHGTVSRTDHILGHKSNLSKFKETEIISSIFSNHNGMRLDMNYKKKN